ncbi:multidrug ABC transporter ATP-binding protein [Lysobacteraceae bacterium NML75-0749]|nr:multidrug ABC transporter ATP-binding protein [Xanthomonadaceae bacterium NML75-0749]PJK02705.1 multidrug ABC transporter ATP-binding protein [Xanthomonadaceae bacterium NML91-0268]
MAQVLAQLESVHMHYGAVRALSGLDTALHAGEVLAVLGRNGAGKSTAIALWLGLARAQSGGVRLFGKAPGALLQRRRIGVMLQSASLPEASTVEELLQVTRACYPQPMALEVCMRLAGLEGLAERRYKQLSGGQQRRVQFALAVCGEPEVLFLDEPTTGLDIDARSRLWAAIGELRQRGTAIVLTTHYLEEAETLADRVLVLEAGRVLAEGTVDEIRRQVALQKIRCHSRLDMAAVAAWPEVVDARRDEAGQLLITTADALKVLPQLMAADSTLAALEVTRPSLSDAFLALTQEPQE